MLHRLCALAMAIAGSLALGLAPVSVAAQMTQIDPNDAIDGDLDGNAAQPGDYDRGDNSLPATDPPLDSGYDQGEADSGYADPALPPATGNGAAADAPAAAQQGGTARPAGYQKDDLIGAAEGVFGKGAKGLAKIIEDILRDQGEPNGYIVGREAGGSLVVGLRYGSGTLHHKVEGELPVYWTGPSIGFDAGADAANTFVLVYNLYDSDELYKRYGAGEGAAYFVGGFHTSYLRRNDVVLIPVRLGVGLRLGANVGYMKFSRQRRILPF